MKKMNVYVDVSNIYYCCLNIHKGKLDYSKLLEFLSPIGTLQRATAFGAQTKDEAKSFIDVLTNLGFESKFKEPKFYGNHTGKADWDVGIAISMIREIPEYDIAVLCSADGDMVPCVEYLREHGKDVVIIGAGISYELQSYATTCIEIPGSMIIRRR